MSALSDDSSRLEAPVTRLVQGQDTEAATGRRERRGRRAASVAEPLDLDARRQRRLQRVSSTSEPLGSQPAIPDIADPVGAGTAIETQQTDREAHRAASGARRHRPRAPKAEKNALADSAATADEAELVDDSAGQPVGSAAAAEVPGINVSVKRSTRTLQRAQRKQQQAAAALENVEDHPALGALNRHLNMLTQQLGTAHRVIGRVAAERDALRQQLADLQGIPIEEIVVTSVGASSEVRDERTARTREPGETPPQTGIARFNYFRHDDIDVMRKRRQTFALVLLSIALGIWLLGSMGFFQMPENLGKDSLAHLPLIGNLMSIFLAGWVLYRVVKIGGKGVKWVFPSEDPRRRRR